MNTLLGYQNFLGTGFVYLTVEDILKQCPEGWQGRVKKFLTTCPPDTKILQIKEKFGQLRLYIQGTPEAYQLANATERECDSLCQACGEPGVLCTRPTNWISTYCPTCMEKTKSVVLDEDDKDV